MTAFMSAVRVQQYQMSCSAAGGASILVLPVGAADGAQVLMRVARDERGQDRVSGRCTICSAARWRCRLAIACGAGDGA